MSRVRRAAATALVMSIALGTGVLASSAPASADDTGGSGPHLVLVGQSPWAPTGGTFTMRLQGVNVPAGTSVALTVHDPLQSRTAFDQSVNGGALPPTRDHTPGVAFDSLPVEAATGDRILTLPLPTLNQGGVYPLEVDLRDASDESIARFVTHIVVEDLTADGHLGVGVPLNVAWIWPLDTEPAYLSTAPTPNPAALADLASTGRLGRQAAQLGRDTDVPVTLAPSPETLDAWSGLSSRSLDLESGAAALRAAGQHDQVLAGPFVPLDLRSVITDGLGGTLTNELGRGINTLEQFFGTHLDPSTALPGPLDALSLSVLQNVSVRQLVVSADSLTPVDEKYTPAHPYKLEPVAGDETTSVTAVATDPGFEKFLTGDDPPALRAAHLLAGLALVADEQPSVPRGVAFMNPSKWAADDTFIEAMFAGLRQNPLLAPTTVSGLLAAVPTATEGGQSGAPAVVRQLTSSDPPAAPVTARAYDQGRADQTALSSLVGSADPRAARADRALATVVTRDWANAAGRRKARALIDSIGTELVSARNQITSQVQVQPRTTITITSSRAQIPIGFKNLSDHDITVHIKLDSDRLLFPDGAEQDVVLPKARNTTVRVAVETRSSGQSPLLVTVTTAGGLLVTQPVRITVRSSFVSGVGVFLTVGAIVFLALWWGWDIRRRRKRPGPQPRPLVGTPPGLPA